ncbi:MAG TPA: hypothetical protein VL860_10540 [Planctomycetota bacterium]|nr:hypothetical protein [Planctomycetota bacterium]
MPRASQSLAISPRLIVAGQPDVSSLAALVAGPPFAGLTGEARAIAVWKFLCERLYHYCAPAETEYGRNYIYDPVTLLNSFGFTICGVTANTLGLLFQAAGFPARIAFISGHEGCEVFYAGRWHYFDSDLQAFHRRHPPEQHIIASREDCFRDPTLVSQQKNPSDPYYIPDRKPETVAKLFEATPRYEFVIGEGAHSMDFVLRPGESMERFYGPGRPDDGDEPIGRWICFDSYLKTWKQFPKEPGPGGPQDRFGQGRSYANGVWRYALDFQRAAGQAAVKDGCSKNVHAGKTGLVVSGSRSQAETGTVVIPFACPYPFAGIPDPTLAEPPVEGVLVEMIFRRKTGKEQIALRIRRDESQPWRDLGMRSTGSDPDYVEYEADLTAELAGHFQFELAIDLIVPAGGAVTLETFDFTGWFVCAPESLPVLQKGNNDLSFKSGDERGLLSQATRRYIRFDAQDAPAALKRHSGTLMQGRLAPGTPELITPTGNEPYRLILPLAAPDGRAIHWLYLLAHVQARLPGAIDDGGVRMEVAATADGPWTLVEHFPLEEHPHRWHFTVDRTVDLAAVLGAPQERCFVRLTTRAGLLGLRWRLHHCAVGGEAVTPLQVSVAWFEKDTLRVKSGLLGDRKRSLTINCKTAPVMAAILFENEA